MARVKKLPVERPKRLVRADDEFEYQPFENNNPLHIDDDTVRNIEHEYGYPLQWCVESCLGQPQDEVMSSHRKNKFQEIHKGSFGGALDYLCDREGRVSKGGLVLMARPVEVTRIARAYEKKAARGAIDDMRRKHSDQGVDVSMPDGGRDPVARQHNRHASSYERIPEE
jgi:hypothetical protein